MFTSGARQHKTHQKTPVANVFHLSLVSAFIIMIFPFGNSQFLFSYAGLPTLVQTYSDIIAIVTIAIFMVATYSA